jgi:hypothetical protein
MPMQDSERAPALSGFLKMRSVFAGGILAAAAAIAPSVAPDVDTIVADAKKAFVERKYAAASDGFARAAEVRPSSWKIRFNLAAASARAGRYRESADALVRVLSRGIDFEVENAEDFAPLRASSEYPRVRQALDELGRRHAPNAAAVAFTLSEKDLLTEGLAFDPRSGEFFVSSVHRRKIVRRRRDGATADFIAEAAGDSWGVLALRVDPERRILWAATAAIPQMARFEKGLAGRSRIDGYDLGTGRRVRRAELTGAGPHAANDLELDLDGSVFVSDSVGSAIYRVPSGERPVETFVPAGTFRSPQGMALLADGRGLCVSDYARGLFRVDLGSRAVSEIPAPDDAFLVGIDGLARFGDELFATQNLASPARVSRIRLSAAGDRVESVDVLELNDARAPEPTLGVIAAGRFWFIGNGQWSRFDEKPGAVDAAHLEEPRVLAIPLEAPRDEALSGIAR